MLKFIRWRIQGRGPGGGGGGGSRGGGRGGGGRPPLFLYQTEAWRAEKTFWRPPPPPFSNGLDDRQPRSVQGLDPALLN